VIRRRVQFGSGRFVPAASFKLLVVVAAGLAGAAIAAPIAPRAALPLIGWDVAGLLLLAATWPHLLRYAPEVVKDHALREDPSRFTADIVLLVASVASLVSVAVVQIRGGGAGAGRDALGLSALALLSVITSWFVIHTVYALRYAELHYREPAGGIDFGDTSCPSYADFAYVAFTLGMTFQVSDTTLKTTELRRTALAHALLSYLFGTVIIASTVSLIAGMGR